ncbi:unnamed protein product [Rotaria sordida]|uniref:BTB domain-containing protein n=1 Tax=Rotaria sordida TaxID=392033 RepID=A0A815KX48_9BILA|nr:unnamed protein product [Rotaria sordida]CAF3866056.1 unnamed protein product [Rotaria sordida]
MQRVQKSVPVNPTHQSDDIIEQPSIDQRRYLEPPLEKRKSLSIKQSQGGGSKRNSAYISDLINVDSLLNIREIQSIQRKLHNTSSFEDHIIINVCGDRYETHRTTLERYPDTLLGNRKRRKYYYDKTRNEYFFDRNRSCFEAILYYYQSHGRLRRPNYVPIDTFLEEINFFQLGQEALNQIRKDENIKEVKKVPLPKNRFRKYLWATMEYPDYSIIAKIVSILSLLMILISTITLAIESLPQYTNLEQSACYNSPINDSNNTNETAQVLYDSEDTCHDYLKSSFFIIQSVCIGFFTIELILRIISAPSFIDFVKDIMNWIDIVAVVPYFIALGIYLADQYRSINTSTADSLRFLRILRFARVLKFYRVFKNIKSLRAFGSTIRESIVDFLFLISILTLLSFLFGAAVYFAENDVNGQIFDSVLKATYWGIITITGVGYGDMTPITPAGRIITCFCALCGAATIGMLVSILVDRYQRVFARKLYINEDIIDFSDFSDDENNDTDSRRGSGLFHRRRSTKETEDSRRASGLYHRRRSTKQSEDFKHGTSLFHRRRSTKQSEDPNTNTRHSSISEKNNKHAIPIINISSAPDIEDIDEDSMNEHNNGVHFIIGYVDNEKHEKSRGLLETISSVVAQKRTSGDDIEMRIISDDQQSSSSNAAKFSISMSSDEATDDDDDDDDDDRLTQITTDH